MCCAEGSTEEWEYRKIAQRSQKLGYKHEGVRLRDNQHFCRMEGSDKHSPKICRKDYQLHSIQESVSDVAFTKGQLFAKIPETLTTVVESRNIGQTKRAVACRF